MSNSEKPKEIMVQPYDASAKLREEHDRKMENYRKNLSQQIQNIHQKLTILNPPVQASKFTCGNPQASNIQTDIYVCRFGEIAFCPCGGIIDQEEYHPWGQERIIEVNRCQKCYKTYSDSDVRRLVREAKPYCPTCNQPLTQQSSHQEYFECMTQGCIDRGHVYHQTEVENLDKTIIQYIPEWACKNAKGEMEILFDEWVVTLESRKCPITGKFQRVSGDQVCKTCGFRV